MYKSLSAELRKESQVIWKGAVGCDLHFLKTAVYVNDKQYVNEALCPGKTISWCQSL